MDTTTLKAQIRSGVTQPKHNGSGMTKLLVANPLDCRTMLAEMATSTGTSQQELIRSAIRSFLINEGHYEPGHFVQRLPKVKELKAREKAQKDQAVHQVAKGVSIVKTKPVKNAAGKLVGTIEKTVKTKAAPKAMTPSHSLGVSPRPTKKTKTEPTPPPVEDKPVISFAADTRPLQPSPEHTWVVRGSGGYWRGPRK